MLDNILYSTESSSNKKLDSRNPNNDVHTAGVARIIAGRVHAVVAAKSDDFFFF